jgi:hypothetical protein
MLAYARRYFEGTYNQVSFELFKKAQDNEKIGELDRLDTIPALGFKMTA